MDTSGALIYAESALGLGAIEGVTDVVYIRPDRFDTAHTQQMADEVNRLNTELRDQKRSYVLVGPGRWGSSDPWLGVPVKWPHISEAKVIVECGLDNFRVEPSQGTHFFQNLTSFGVGYLTINPFQGAYEILSKSVNAPMLKTIQDIVTSNRSGVSEEEAVLLWPNIIEFVQNFKKEPSLQSNDPYERRLGEVLAFVRRKKAEAIAKQEEGTTE